MNDPGRCRGYFFDAYLSPRALSLIAKKLILGAAGLVYSFVPFFVLSGRDDPNTLVSYYKMFCSYLVLVLAGSARGWCLMNRYPAPFETIVELARILDLLQENEK
jgi:hypothetical protein